MQRFVDKSGCWGARTTIGATTPINGRLHEGTDSGMNTFRETHWLIRANNRALDLHARGQWFETTIAHHSFRHGKAPCYPNHLLCREIFRGVMYMTKQDVMEAIEREWNAFAGLAESFPEGDRFRPGAVRILERS